MTQQDHRRNATLLNLLDLLNSPGLGNNLSNLSSFSSPTSCGMLPETARIFAAKAVKLDLAAGRTEETSEP